MDLDIVEKLKTNWDHSKNVMFRSSRPELFLGKGVLKLCRKFAGEHICRCVVSLKLQSNFIEITLRHGCSPVNLLHIFRTPLPMNTSGWLLLKVLSSVNSIYLENKNSPSLVQSSSFINRNIVWCLYLLPDINSNTQLRVISFHMKFPHLSLQKNSRGR